jgi:chemotaxis protein MotB
MRRRQKPREPENHERWLVSYADFITLLFAFFVVMYASSQADSGKAAQFSESVRRALENGAVSQAIARFLGTPTVVRPGAPLPSTPQQMPKPKPSGPPELLPSLMELNENLRKEIEAGRVDLRLENRGLVISLREKTFFPSGADVVEPSTLPVLRTIAEELRRLPNTIRMEGHTDSIPIRTVRFPSNWDLSAARAIALLRLFESEFQIPAPRMSVAGYADTAPVASNDNNDGRNRNRRVDIVVLNEVGRKVEPQQTAVAQSAAPGVTASASVAGVVAQKSR